MKGFCDDVRPEDRDGECGRRERAARQVWEWDCGIGLRVLGAVLPLTV
jgi:hypothetical protein